MNKSSEIESKIVMISDNAVDKLKALIADEEDAASLKLRVYVSGGGCAGFQYGFKFDANTIDGDTEVEKNGVRLVIDPMSIQYLQGAEVDYEEGLQGAQFVVRNPNASTTCGCGSSFSI
jgi:iron-sulfur cluster insertion protein